MKINLEKLDIVVFREGLTKIQNKFSFDQKRGGGWRKNQLFYFSTNNEYGI